MEIIQKEIDNTYYTCYSIPEGEVNQLTVSEFVKYLLSHGVTFVKHGAKHDMYRGINGHIFTISRDKTQDYGKRMIEKIKKQAGLK